MSYTKGEWKSEKIAKILKEFCPALYRGNGVGGSCWHHCFCRAQKPNKSGQLQSCDCVWHITDHCIAGVWPQLAFINEEHKAEGR